MKNGIDFIVNSAKPYPDWIKNHVIFKELSKIDKIFPKIGLSNFKEPCEISNTREAKDAAQILGNRFIRELDGAKARAYSLYEEKLNSNEQNRNELCSSIINAINIISEVVRSLRFFDYIKVIDGKVAMKLRSDIFDGNGKNPIFKKDESIIRVMNKISGMDGIHLPAVEQMSEFKAFSKANLPTNKYTLCFSSHGEDGAWDIGTVSMRGITSCQAWNAPQSRGLIGSIASKFVGVMYLASNEKVAEYGTKMLNRSMVRFIINNQTKTPALYLDTMYPNSNEDVVNAFTKALTEKTGLQVISRHNINEYYIPSEYSNKYLKQGEFSYMDTQIPIKEHAPSIKKVISKDIESITQKFKENVCADLNKMISIKRELYTEAQKRIEPLKKEYEATKKNWEEENKDKPEDQRTKFDLDEPKIDAELAAFGGGGVVNLLTHCEKRYGKGSTGKVFADLILNSIGVENPHEYYTPEEYHRKYLMTFLKNSNKIKELALVKYSQGSWMKSFPKSSAKFFEFIFSQMRGYMLNSCKEIIKKSN